MDESKQNQPTPEQLMKMLDMQMAASRQKRLGQGNGNRNIFRILSLVFIVVITMLAYWVLSYMLEQMRSQKNAEGPEPKEITISR
jgi:heme/copper-type cytochrome/quinol oxidase subunit 2